MGKMRVAIIGAGAAGLCSARHCQEIAQVDEIVIFEQSAQLGGVWVFTDTNDGITTYSAVYRNMRLVVLFFSLLQRSQRNSFYCKGRGCAGKEQTTLFLKDFIVSLC